VIQRLRSASAQEFRRFAHAPGTTTAFLICSLLLLLSNCATQRPPSGGPPDTEPPTVVETYPAQGTVRFSDTYARIVWSEYIDRRSFERAVHVSPVPDGALTYDWSGKSVEIRFPGSLAAERTYVITIGTGVKDIRGSNAIRQSFQLAFATGDSLDAGIFSGAVFDSRPAGVSLFAYLLTGRNPDTLNPTSQRPDFLVQSGDDGLFVFNNVPTGPYRVFAVRDNQGNYLYERESDEIGIAQEDVTVQANDSIGPSLRFRLTVEDTTAPYVQTAECVTNRQVQVKFSEALSRELPDPARISIVDSVSKARIATLSIAPVPGKKFQYDVITSAPLSETTYLIELDSLFDAAGNAASRTGVRSFVGSAVQDSVRTRIITSYPSSKAADIRVDSVFHVLFSLPMRVGGTATLLDSARAVVPCDLSWSATNNVIIRHAPLRNGMPYTLCLDGAMWRDSLRGQSVADSAVCFPFTTERDDVFGQLSGTVVDTTASETPAIVRAVLTERKDFSVTTRTTGKGVYVFPRIPAGKYMLDAYKDSDGNGRYTFGNAFPFRPSERFGSRADTIRVRAKWETKDAVIRIP
jgi:uncharacterized protein (DUF2141 family)